MLMSGRITHFLPKLFAACLLVFLFPAFLSAQQEDGERSTGELLENFFRDSELGDESDAQALLEYLDYLRDHPLNLNKATEDDLIALGVLNRLQIEQFLEYRETLGPFLNIFELQAVPGFNLDEIRLLSYFTEVKTGTDTRSQSIWKGLYQGENELLARWGRQFPAFYPSTSEGGPDITALRFRHRFDNRLFYGVTMEKDAGEAFFGQSNPYGYDFYSAHLYARDVNRFVKTLALGDYSVIFGQGLLLQTGFAPGKSAESILVSRGGRTVRAYSAFGESFFLRGAATTLRFGDRWETTLLYSNRNRDANITMLADTIDLEDPELSFTSLQTSGLHRTPSEIEDERALGEQVGAARISHKWKGGHISLNGIYYKYNEPWEPRYAPYREFTFRGSELMAFSADYEWHYRNLLIFGETARSDNGGLATVNGLLLSPARPVTLALVQRSYARDYQSIYAGPFGESSRPANEQGVYLGMEVRPSKPWRINAYMDTWKHPWLRFFADAPSRGWDYLLRVSFTPRRGVNFYALWQTETKQQTDDIDIVSGLLASKRERFRVHASYKVGGGFEMRSRVEWTRFSIESYPANQGYVAYQELVFKPLSGPISGSARYTIFDTESFNTRVFTFENDLFAALSIPAFSGRGSRYYFNLRYRINRDLRISARFEQTVQSKTVTTGTSVGKRSVLKLQLRYKF